MHKLIFDYNDTDSNALNMTYEYKWDTYGKVAEVNDPNGNLTNDGVYKYYYDCENRLIDVNDQSNNQVASYKYDFAGRRVSKTDYTLSPARSTLYCYDGDQVIAEYEDDTLVRKFIYGPGIDEPICMIDVNDSNTVYYYHYDGLGSVVALTDSNGDIVEKYSYDVFGQPTILSPSNEIRDTSNVGNAYMFTGRRYDSETDNYYYRARYYNPEIGRFLQTDPIGYWDSMNLYQYCGNNPINWIDPWGLEKDGINYNDMNKWEKLWEFMKVFGEGFLDGLEIATNEYTFGGTDALGLTDGKQLVDDYGGYGTASQKLARFSRNTAIAAAGTGIAGKVTSKTQTITRATRGADGATSQIVKTTSKITGKTTKVVHKVTKGGKVIHKHTKHKKFLPF